MAEIVLGCEVRDIVTGFTGIATGKIEYLNGCLQYSVRPKMDKDGKVADALWFDVESLERIGDGVSPKRRLTGGSDSNVASLPNR